MTYYHVCPTLLDKGSIILPGNFGRIIRDMGIEHPLWSRENILEFFRKENFPDKPSRLNATFVFETKEATEFFKTHNCPNGVIYKVAPTNPKAKRHEGDLHCLQPTSSVGDWEEIARRYWEGKEYFEIGEYEHIKFKEILFDCGLVIAEAIA